MNFRYKLEGIFGTSTHPDLLKKQAALTAEKSYVKASKELTLLCHTSINSTKFAKI